MAPGEFLREVTHHLRYTCLKEPPEAGPVDLYRAMAHTVRDRLVERWLATQRKYVDGDVKRSRLAVAGGASRIELELGDE